MKLVCSYEINSYKNRPRRPNLITDNSLDICDEVQIFRSTDYIILCYSTTGESKVSKDTFLSEGNTFAS